MQARCFPNDRANQYLRYQFVHKADQAFLSQGIADNLFGQDINNRDAQCLIIFQQPDKRPGNDRDGIYLPECFQDIQFKMLIYLACVIRIHFTNTQA